MPSDLIRGCAAVFPKEAQPNNERGSFLDSSESGTTLANARYAAPNAKMFIAVGHRCAACGPFAAYNCCSAQR
jgi:hypothetical protein